MVKLRTLLVFVSFTLCFSTQLAVAFSPSPLVEITNKRGQLQICNGDLGDIFKQYMQANTAAEVYFEDLQILKVNKAYYLLATEQNSSKAYAFFLTRYKGALVLDTAAGIVVTEAGRASLRAALLQGTIQSPYLHTLSFRQNQPNTSTQHTH
ncbi:hypothetical protein ACMA1I_02530 [Pontibacter sp. 13R65]|uniref:hypothetical protein n=1 Tax=Pontibacter sp. 13R65 TaxID=3127458 RepID=UPI00301B8D3A